MQNRKFRELRIHWPVLAGSFVGIMFGWALPVFVIGPISGPLIHHFGWSPPSVLASASFYSLGSAIGALIVGRLADRLDPRIIASGGLVALAVCFALLGALTAELWHLRLLYLLMGAVGAGSGAIIYTRVIGSRIVSTRGIALAIALSGTGATSFLIPIFVTQADMMVGWRAIGPGIAGLILFIALPSVLFGLRPPKPGADAALPTVEQAALTGMTRTEALRDPRFYLLALSICIFGFFSNPLIISMVPALVQAGTGAPQAAQIASLLGVTIIVGRFGTGWLLDHYPAPYVAGSLFALGAIGAFLFTIGTPLLAVVGVLSIGLLLGAEIDVMSYMTLRYFGVRHFGEVYGLLMAVYTLINVGGPLFAAAMLANGGGYAAVYGVASVSFFVATAALLILSRLPNGR